jgi:hypothetical protein
VLRLNADFLVEITESVGHHALHGIAVGENQRETRSIPRAEILFDKMVERLIDGLVGAGRIFRKCIEREEV